MCLNHPETVSPQPLVHGKIDFHRIGPWCQKGWGHVLKLYFQDLGKWIPSFPSYPQP